MNSHRNSLIASLPANRPGTGAAQQAVRSGMRSKPALRAAERLRAPNPRLAALMVRNAPLILDDWDRFAAGIASDDRPLAAQELRDHGTAIVARIAFVLSQWPGVDPDATDLALDGDGLAPAERHADARRLAGFTIDQTLAEFASLRASVLRICATGLRDTGEVAAFHGAVDRALAQSARRYEQQTKAAVDLFLGVLAHDIRNPLGTILMRAEYAVLARQLAPAWGNPIINAAERIKGIVEQTVDFSRLQSFGSLPVRREPGDLAVHLAKVVEETQVRQPEGAVAFEIAGDLRGSWDAGRLAQVLSNLLGNACAYGARGSVITVRIWSGGDEGFFSVHNHGVAIPAHEAVRIFEPMFRGGAGLVERRARDGLGLGLYICREIVRAHGGQLSLVSDALEGTTFTVRLPREVAAGDAGA